MKVLVIGAGPAGIYTVDEVNKLANASSISVEFDVINQDQKAGGLVLYGVAPDHPKIRAVANVFQKILEANNVRYLGGVTYGKDFTLADCKELYDAVVFSFGAQGDKKLSIPGEELVGSYAAREVVNWYNDHPSSVNCQFDLKCSKAVVIGAGNVAADVARILVRSTAELSQTDISRNALAELEKSNIKEVVISIRRGPHQVKFSPSELKALGELSDVEIKLLNDKSILEVSDAEQLDKDSQKNLALFREFFAREPKAAARKITFLFYSTPVEILSDDQVKVSQVRFMIGKDQSQKELLLSTGLVIRSVGYDVVSVADLPFDSQKRVIANQEGRIEGESYKGCYVVGWAADGPIGIIGTNKTRAKNLAKTIVEDLLALKGEQKKMTGDLFEIISKRK